MTQVRLPGEERMSLIVSAAFAAVATEGFEGLRTRDIASAVNINPATLHHYFPTKEDLVAGVAQRLAQLLALERARPVSGTSALVELRRQFAYVRFYQEQRPDFIAVYRELAVRAIRDDAARAAVEGIETQWRHDLEALLKRGVSEGAFRGDIVPSVAATALVAAVWGGVALLRLSPAAMTRMCTELENGIIATKP
jgi:AcrR family transcriptional regulator